MINRYIVHPFSFRISLFFSLIFFASCTYDYFEDETNYVVYAPKANSELMTDEYRIGDIRIYIYNETLGRQKSASYPFQENARIKFGNFNFRLFPGSYSTYCFANTAGIDFYGTDALQDALFGLPESQNNEYRYPASLAGFLTEVKNPEIKYPAPVKTDTAYFDRRYSGRISVAFERLAELNPLLTYDNIKGVKVEATGVGTYQSPALLTDSIHTRSSRYSPADKVAMECITYEEPLEGYDFGIDAYFFPSLSDEGEGSIPITLSMDFIGHDGNSIHAFSLSLRDYTKNETIILHMNQTIYLSTDGRNTFVLEIGGPEPWNPEIEGGDDDGIGM